MRSIDTLRIAVAVLTTMLFSSVAFAQKPAVPDATVQEILIKTSLLTFNDANITGNYQVFHARLAKPFRDKFSVDQVASTFKGFHDKHIYLDLIAARTPNPSEPAKIDDNGRLTLKGYFDATSGRVYYDLAFILADDYWQLIQISVDLRKAGDPK